MENFNGVKAISIRCLLALLGAYGVSAFSQSIPSGKVEFAQTHVVQRSGGTKNAEVQIMNRQALFLFTPDSPIPSNTTVQLSIRRGNEVVKNLPLNSPDTFPGNLEDGLTTEKLDPYSTTAWSVTIPAEYMTPEYTLSIKNGNEQSVDVTPLKWARPADFTIARVPLILWNSAGLEPRDSKESLAKLSKDYFATIPVSKLSYFDYLPFRLNYVVARPGAEPSPKRYTKYVDGLDTYNIMSQLAIRVSLANTGRGLLLRDESGNPIPSSSSPYSFGTYAGLGWYYNDAMKKYEDISGGGGWTGWAAIWNNEGQCGNGFTHEVGHSLTLYHFTSGEAQNWGISDEYPNDGVNGPKNPWGFDTTRNLFRTWYRVDENGPVKDESGKLVGKHDPMNGGELPNKITCFPQYTAYQTMKMQNWLNTTPTILTQDGVPGIYQWNNATHKYDKSAPVDGALTPTKVGVPVVTVLGTLTKDTTMKTGTSQIYPVSFAKSGNIFALPSPFASDLPLNIYRDARYFLKIIYTDNSVDFVLIPSKEILDDKQFEQFSLNLDLRRGPNQVQLYHARKGYPNIASAADADFIDSRFIVVPKEDSLPSPGQIPDSAASSKTGG